MSDPMTMFLKYRILDLNHTNLNTYTYAFIAITTLGVTGLSNECYGVLDALLSSFHCTGSLEDNPSIRSTHAHLRGVSRGKYGRLTCAPLDSILKVRAVPYPNRVTLVGCIPVRAPSSTW